MLRPLAELLDVLIPRTCAGCRAETVTLCGRCLEELAAPVRATIPRYGTVPVVGAGEYEAVLRSCLVSYKEHDRRDLIPVLSALVARAVIAVLEHSAGPAAPAAGALLVPVPAARSAVRRRGANHVTVLAQGAVELLRAEGLEISLADILEVAAHRDQVGFGSLARRRNVRGTHRVRSGVRVQQIAGSQPCVIVLDDICTTGSTVAESTRALRRSRVPVHGVAVVGIAPGGPRFDPGDGI